MHTSFPHLKILSWLPGDPRGWRTRHHRAHVDGDYKNLPSPGSSDQLHARSKQLMSRPPFRLPKALYETTLTAFIAALKRRKIELIIASLDHHHLHILARFPDRHPRHWLGLAQKETARILSGRQLIPPGGAWAKRPKCLPIADRAHQLQVVQYILNHHSRGSHLWHLPSIHP